MRSVEGTIGQSPSGCSQETDAKSKIKMLTSLLESEPRDDEDRANYDSAGGVGNLNADQSV